MYKVGLSIGEQEFTNDVFSKLREANIDAVELSASCREPFDRTDFSKVKEMADQNQIGLWSFHLPFAPFTQLEISTKDKEVREHTIRYFTELIQRGAAVGIDKFVIHPSGEPITDEERGERLKYSKDSLSVLADISRHEGAVLAVEDLPRTCLGNTTQEIQELISVNDNLRVCFDTNHLLQDDPVLFIQKIRDKIVTLHVSDYDFVNERHWLPGEGLLDWQKIYKALLGIGYDGIWLYEVDLATPKTITRKRDLTYQDFAINAHEIFANERLILK